MVVFEGCLLIQIIHSTLRIIVFCSFGIKFHDFGALELGLEFDDFGYPGGWPRSKEHAQVMVISLLAGSLTGTYQLVLTAEKPYASSGVLRMINKVFRSQRERNR